MTGAFEPTDQQLKIIGYGASAFISACPGAGKTRVLVERARELLAGRLGGRGIAFLSFTNAAVAELEARLRQDAKLPSPAFPHFIGTFDSFLWQFLVAPFGIPGLPIPPRLVPDLEHRTVRPFEKAIPLPLSCFDRKSGELLATPAKKLGFDVFAKPAMTKAYVTAARKARERFWARGELGYDDARDIASTRLADLELSARISTALCGRFQEVIVDEAQDCNPSDLEVISWLHEAGISTKIICDPHQSIYAFRGGVTEQLVAFGKKFPEDSRLPMTGNFRSSRHITRAIVALRTKEARDVIDEAIGPNRDHATPVYVLPYAGSAVTEKIGEKFLELIDNVGLSPSDCPVLAKTRQSGAKAIGQPTTKGKLDLTLRLAMATMDYHFAFEAGNRRAALEDVHAIVLEILGKLDGKTYHQHLVAEGITANSWRPMILALVRRLKFDPAVFANADEWHALAKALIGPMLAPGGFSIGQRLKKNAALEEVLGLPPVSGSPARTIHSVKGLEFPGVCVVMTKNSKAIIDFLETGIPQDHAEDAREIYVAASRAEKLLAIAVPKSQAQRLALHLRSLGSEVTVMAI
ncbi:ATP-dependent helicase [Mesorhizobium sp. M6A.T.Cr.TU.016.01.1.1]|uniref:UvrD-helicase domain-containing protein n=1 Tax=Mesorhizobium sp. M6A.T.Cr.TU.016.01.1.1 TaxID=2493677 RepID=UPI000F75D763|nr:ATP-dependent helicase [Mesorhizobium sp. M6A.T.Cr.TU.016.01.1.1]AZO68021.1 ATP-dependent helicase [Mesorhizobium sp. M6A.T.Cr.TU.016.01.1.1]